MTELRRCKGTWAFCAGDCEKCNTTVTTQTSMMYLIPPNADVVEVVRCKDCEFYYEDERMCNDTNGFDRYWKPTDFCSYGKRREDGSEL